MHNAFIFELLPGDASYPSLLASIPDAPKSMYVKGILPEKDIPVLAIVGTRRATPEGKHIAYNFAHTLARYGFIIVSGLAFGIDAAAHAGCLDAGGKTIAVLACGLDRVYPRSHATLADKIIAAGGALMSEYTSGTPPLPYRFLERNRIVSGLSSGVLIIECPDGSGSLATARFAAEQGRDAFVIPGPISHPNYVGSHDLIRAGAQLVTTPEHILEAYQIDITPPQQTVSPQNFSAHEIFVFEFLKAAGEALDVDKIADAAKLQPQAVSQALTLLIIKGVIKETATGYMLL